MSHSSTNSQPVEILIVDDHRLLLNGTISLVSDHFPRAQIRSCQTVQDALTEVRKHLPDLAIVDLSLPESSGTAANVEQGLGLLKCLMQDYPQLNLMVQSSNVKGLIRIMPEIDNHQGGFTIADNSLPIDTFLMRMEWAMLGFTHTKDLQTDVEVKPEWLEVMRLAFDEGLQDKAIALSMHKSERMIRHYWSKIQDALEIYPEEGKNMRAQTQIHAREIGLID